MLRFNFDGNVGWRPHRASLESRSIPPGQAKFQERHGGYPLLQNRRMKKQRSIEQDVIEWRRYGHWSTSAKKAHFAAFVLWHGMEESRLSEMVRESAYTGGDAGLALHQAFQRESAIALELVVKAVIARKLEARGADPATECVPATHDLPKLWTDAGLPELPREDKYRLLRVKQVLLWSGRYGTPLTAEAWKNENKAFDALEDPPPEPVNSNQPREFIFRKPITIGWSDFDRLFKSPFRSFSVSVQPEPY